MQETQVWSLGQKDPPEEEMVTPSNIQQLELDMEQQTGSK